MPIIAVEVVGAALIERPTPSLHITLMFSMKLGNTTSLTEISCAVHLLNFQACHLFISAPTRKLSNEIYPRWSWTNVDVPNGNNSAMLAIETRLLIS